MKYYATNFNLGHVTISKIIVAKSFSDFLIQSAKMADKLRRKFFITITWDEIC